MTHEMQGRKGGREETPEEMTGTSRGTHDPLATGLGGTPVGGARGPSRRTVAKKSGAPRQSGARAKQPTKRASVKQKAKRAATAAGSGLGARAAKKAGARKTAAKKTAGGAARKAAATKSTARKRATKLGATRRQVTSRR